MSAPVRFFQVRTGLCSPPTAQEVERRYRCIEAQHEGVTYNPVQDATWCLCGRAVRSGDRGRGLSPYERAEAAASRPDGVGGAGRAYLAWVWSGRPAPVPVADWGRLGRRSVAELMGEWTVESTSAPEPETVPTEVGDQYVLEVGP